MNERAYLEFDKGWSFYSIPTNGCSLTEGRSLMEEFLDHPLVQGYIKANNFGILLGMEFKIEGPGDIVYTMPITEQHLATPIAGHMADR